MEPLTERQTILLQAQAKYLEAFNLLKTLKPRDSYLEDRAIEANIEISNILAEEGVDLDNNPYLRGA